LRQLAVHQNFTSASPDLPCGGRWGGVISGLPAIPAEGDEGNEDNL
jgi:hypothetical protein